MKLTLVAGARPNFMKIAPMIRAIESHNRARQTPEFFYRLVHTGQHYDDKLSKVFFEELELPEPDVNLGVGSGSQAEQTARIMVEFEKDLLRYPTDMVVVVGDVNSTMACTIVAKKLNTPVAHVEGGIRSYDLSMPEEINRMVTDSIADYFFTTSEVANENLRRSGVTDERIFFVGNTMIDSLMASLPRLTAPAVWSRLNLRERGFILLTLHRPSNVDDEDHLRKLLSAVESATQGYPVVFPVHPRTRKNFDKIKAEFPHILDVDPLSYFNFLYLVQRAKGVVTDSGGVQEETTVLGIPCITLRTTTERPETVDIGTNELIGIEPEKLYQALSQLMTGAWKKGKIPPLWDGQTGKRIIAQLASLFQG